MSLTLYPKHVLINRDRYTNISELSALICVLYYVHYSANGVINHLCTVGFLLPSK